MIKIVNVKSHDENILHNLIQFYIYEFSKFVPEIRLEEDGAFKPFDLEKYWEDPNLHAFFIMLDNEYIGFSLVESESTDSPNTILEFFILSKYSGKGFGTKAATKILRLFPGNWMITQIEANQPAKDFWESVLSRVAVENLTQRIDENHNSIQEFYIYPSNKK
ncbi:GNAT family N-acetyltransferase [Virgibacillus sp. DJP39]|uniref:GNAT family N-acetyltransferase n=1 Tax=Virgibacillus sp. DJP39 TaxID=3409790 RepID=UPI003BB79A4E